VTRRWFK